MITEKEIEAAIGAHGLWKARLKQAIDTGSLDVTVQTIEADDQCQFGKWLVKVSAEALQMFGDKYSRVKERHAAFHKIASRVAALALSGKKAEATAMLDFRGDYAAASAKLTEAMLVWKSAIAKQQQPVH